jgi:CTP:molybdopterin cytidylyltransferase MocA
MATRFAGVILGGGRGERYGGPKALVLLPDGRSFLDACVGSLAAAAAAPIVATLPPDLEVPTIAGLTPVALPADGLAMFDSLRLALARASQEHGWVRAVVLPVDHPLVAPAAIRALAAVGATAAIPSFRGKHGHPIMLCRALAEEIAAGAHPGPTLREVLHAAAAVDVAVDDPGILANCNAPEVLAAAWRSLGR